MRLAAVVLALAALCLAPLPAADVPKLEPLVGVPPHPPDNPPTLEKIKLGETLFFDEILSGGNRRSCGTCHKPQLLFMDGFSRGWGLDDILLPRKTPGLMNVGWQRSMFFDGRVKTLEEQVPEPLKNHREMRMNPPEAAERVAADPFYRKEFAKVFPGEPITFGLIAKAIASFERTLISNDSDLDRYLLGDASALGDEAKSGMELFTGKAGCIRCHNGPLLSDHQFHYTGVPEFEGDTAKPGDKYKTAPLRDVTLRASFMHNGHYLKIEQVLDHYVNGGAAPEGLKAEVSPIQLTDGQRADLIAFLQSLNGRLDGEGRTVVGIF